MHLSATPKMNNFANANHTNHECTHPWFGEFRPLKIILRLSGHTLSGWSASIPATENNLDIRCQVGLDYGYWINDPHTLPGWSAAKRTSCSWLGGIKRVLIDQLRAKTVGAHRWEKLCTGKVLSSAIHPLGLFHEIPLWCLLFAGLLYMYNVHI